MDRREALKKIGIGGATVAGASVIVSSPAFAFTNPSPPAQPTLTQTRTGQFLGPYFLNVTIGPGTAGCPGSATGGTDVIGVRQVSSATDGATASPATQSATDGDLLVQFRRNAFEDDAVATINYFAEYRCTYPGQQTEACRSWTITYNAINAGLGSIGWSLASSITAPGSNCP